MNTQTNPTEWPEEFEPLVPITPDTAKAPVKATVSQFKSGVTVSLTFQPELLEELDWVCPSAMVCFVADQDDHVFLKLRPDNKGPFALVQRGHGRLTSSGVKLSRLDPALGIKGGAGQVPEYRVSKHLLTIRLPKGDNPMKVLTRKKKTSSADGRAASDTPVSPDANGFTWRDTDDAILRRAHKTGKYVGAAHQIGRGVTEEQCRRRGLALSMAGQS